MEQSLKKVFKNISAQPLKIRQLQRSFQPHLRFQLSKVLSFFSRCAYCLSSSRDKVECFRVFLQSKMLCCDWWGFFYGCHRRVSFLDVTELFPRRCAVVPPFFFFFIVGHPRLKNFYSTVPVGVVRVTSYLNCLFDPVSVPVRVTINKLNLILKRLCCGRALKRRRSEHGLFRCIGRTPSFCLALVFQSR